MQNPDILNYYLEEIDHYAPIELIRGDAFCPLLAVRINDFELPDTVVERQVDIIIPLPRCAGYAPGTTLAGLHLSHPLHGIFQGEKTVIPFCDPVEDTDWLVKTQRFYPLYSVESASLIDTSYLCLNDPQKLAESPLELITTALQYLCRWRENAFELAAHHGAIARGDAVGDSLMSADWVEHLVQHVAPGFKQKLLAVAYPDRRV